MDFQQSLMISAAGLRAQSVRMRVIAENMANQNSIAAEANQDPYRRKTILFKNVLDRELGVDVVKVDRISFDKSEFGQKYDPGHPAANAEGYVTTTNVSGIVENMDLRQAQRTYESNLNAIEAAKNMMTRTVELLR